MKSKYNCDFCGKEYVGVPLIIKSLEIIKKDGSDLRVCGECFNFYTNGEFEKIKVKGKNTKKVLKSKRGWGRSYGY